MNDVVTNGYICKGMSCSSCYDNNTSLADKCRKMVDCMLVTWPCSSDCRRDCFNKTGGSDVLNTCIKLLENAACTVPGCGATPAGPATDASPLGSDASTPSSEVKAPSSDVFRPNTDVAAPALDAAETVVDAPVPQVEVKSL
jgi:hypothetical protein